MTNPDTRNLTFTGNFATTIFGSTGTQYRLDENRAADVWVRDIPGFIANGAFITLAINNPTDEQILEFQP
jgi:hypothetical protein